MIAVDRDRFWALVRAFAAVSVAAQASACGDVLGVDAAVLASSSRDAGPEKADAAPVPNGSERPAVCGDTSSEPQHCGACGHVCDGALCRDGRCEPVVLASGQVNANKLAIVGDELFWSIGALMHCPKADCFGGPTSSLCAPSTEGGPLEFAVHTSPNIVAAVQGGVAGLCPWTEGTMAVLAQPDLLFAVKLAYLGDDLLLARVQYPAPGNTPVPSLLRCTPPMCTDAKVVASNIMPLALAADGSGAVFATKRSQGVADLQRVSIDGAISLVAATQPAPSTIVLGGNHVAWLSDVSQRLALVCELPSCAGGARVIGKHASVDSVAIDETYAYYIDAATRTVHRCAIADCDRDDVTIAVSQNGATSIAIDATHVYWSNVGDSTIVKLRKPPR